jgi:hypothetical protein
MSSVSSVRSTEEAGAAAGRRRSALVSSHGAGGKTSGVAGRASGVAMGAGAAWEDAGGAWDSRLHPASARESARSRERGWREKRCILIVSYTVQLGAGDTAALP